MTGAVLADHLKNVDWRARRAEVCRSGPRGDHRRGVAEDRRAVRSGFVGLTYGFGSVLFAVAEMEQETRRERQAAGIAIAKRNGVYQGRKAGSLKADAARSCVAKQGLERYGDCNSLEWCAEPCNATCTHRQGSRLARPGGWEGPLFGRIPYGRKNLRGRVALSTGHCAVSLNRVSRPIPDCRLPYPLAANGHFRPCPGPPARTLGLWACQPKWRLTTCWQGSLPGLGSGTRRAYAHAVAIRDSLCRGLHK